MISEATKTGVANGINVDGLYGLIDDVKQNAARWPTTTWQGQTRSRAHVDGVAIDGKEDDVKETIDARDERKPNCLEQELNEERFLERFAALEESLALLQAQMHSMSENAKLFGSLARHIRRSTCPATGHQQRGPAVAMLR